MIKTVAVLTQRFYLIYRDIGMSQQFVDRFAVAEIDGDADRGQDVHFVSIKVERTVRAFQEFVGDDARVIVVAQFRHHDREFVATLAR